MITIEITNGERVYKWDIQLRSAHFLPNTVTKRWVEYSDFTIIGAKWNVAFKFFYCWIKFRVPLEMFQDEQHLLHQHMQFIRDTALRSTPTCLPAPRSTTTWRWRCLLHDPGRSPSETPQPGRVMTRRPSTLFTLTSYQKTRKETRRTMLKASCKEFPLKSLLPMPKVLKQNDNKVFKTGCHGFRILFYSAAPVLDLIAKLEIYVVRDKWY